MYIKKDVGKKIAKIPRATRKAIVSLLDEHHDIDDIMEKIQEYVELEEATYDYWFGKMLKDMKDLRIDPECYAYELFEKLDYKEIDVNQLVKLAAKRLKEHQRITNGHNGRMLEQLKRLAERYVNRSNAFYEYAPSFIQNYDMPGLKLRIEEHNRSERMKDKYKLFQLQMIKHMRVLLADDDVLPTGLMKLALSTEFSDDPKILGEQVVIVDRTYNYHKEQSLVIKQMCFDFTKHVLTNVISNAVLIDYLFKEDWISWETHDLLIGAYENIKSYGMDALVYARAQKLFEKNGLADKKPENLNVQDKYIIDLMEKFSKKT